MIILNLGVDNTGKTTLSKRILKEFPYYGYVKPFGPLNQKTQKNITTGILNVVKHRNNTPILYERFPLLDEMVYGEVLRGRSNFKIGHELYKQFLETLKSHDYFIIYNRPTTEIILRTLEEREQMDGVVDNVFVLLERYDSLIRRLERDGLEVSHHNFNLKNHEIGSTEFIINKIKELEREKHGKI